MTRHVLTTVDNPYDPVEQFKEWNAFDQAAGYHTLSYLARVVKTSEILSEADQSLAIEQGINDIIQDNVLGIYRKVPIKE